MAKKEKSPPVDAVDSTHNETVIEVEYKKLDEHDQPHSKKTEKSKRNSWMAKLTTSLKLGLSSISSLSFCLNVARAKLCALTKGGCRGYGRKMAAIVGGLFLLWIFNSTFEAIFVPSASLIPAMQQDIQKLNADLKSKTDQITELKDTIAAMKGGMSREIEKLKQTEGAILANVQQLESKLQQTPMNDASPIVATTTFKDLESSWLALNERIKQGQSFNAELTALQSFAGNDENLQQAIKGLNALSAMPFKTLEALSNDLATFKAKLIFEATPGQEGWFASLWTKVKGLIQIDQGSQTVGNVPLAQKTHLVTVIDASLLLIKENKLREAIAGVQKLDHKMIPALDGWIENANTHLLLLDRMELLQSLVKPHLASAHPIVPDVQEKKPQ